MWLVELFCFMESSVLWQGEIDSLTGSSSLKTYNKRERLHSLYSCSGSQVFPNRVALPLELHPIRASCPSVFDFSAIAVASILNYQFLLPADRDKHASTEWK